MVKGMVNENRHKCFSGEFHSIGGVEHSSRIWQGGYDKFSEITRGVGFAPVDEESTVVVTSLSSQAGCDVLGEVVLGVHEDLENFIAEEYILINDNNRFSFSADRIDGQVGAIRTGYCLRSVGEDYLSWMEDEIRKKLIGFD